ncbi:MAG: hypothetical protein JWO37_1837 [Acidimicrobiales bacterium]|jgi:hypothetical protein|nr:hypothetical protein [Acidimicrobiales bacterium]
MAYEPLQPGGVDDYPVKVGSMLLTMVDPHKGFEKAYNRWYERDHYYGGCLVGPHLFAGSRWVAPRELKDLRWPHGDAVAQPWDAGSYVAIYWVEDGHHDDHFAAWARPQVFSLYGSGRGFSERRHIHTVLFDRVGAVYRDDDPVPVELALDHAYDGIVALWLDGRDGTPAAALHDRLAAELLPKALAGSPIEIASSWTPSAGENEPRNSPMDLGSAAGGPERLAQLFFIGGDVRDAVAPLRAYSDAIEAEGLADTRLGAPFFRTVVGTDRYVDRLW